MFSKLINRFKNYISFKVITIVRNQWQKIDGLKDILADTVVGKHVKLYPTYRIVGCEIGDYTYISESCTMSYTKVGKFCSIGPNLLSGWGIHPTNGISTSPMFYSTKQQNGISITQADKIEERKTIIIGNDVFIGMNVTILDGVTIGDGAVIGAGAVVSKDIPPYAIAVGSPIEIKKYRFKPEAIDALLKIQWWNWDEGQLSNVEQLFWDPEKFTNQYS